MNAAGLNLEIQIVLLITLRALIIRARSGHQHWNLRKLFLHTGVSSFAGDAIYPGTEDSLDVQIALVS